MKKLLCIILVIILCLAVCACGKTERVYESVIPEQVDSAPLDFSSAVTVVSSPTPLPEASATPEIEYTPAPLATPTPTPAPTTQIVNVVTNTGIVKNPTSETVPAGGTAKFICYTNASNNASWIIKAPGAVYGVDANDAPNSYAGLSVSGQGTSTLTLSNIPLSMNGCKIQAHFGEDYSANALLTVTDSGYNPADKDSSTVKQVADNCYKSIAASAIAKGYTVSAMQNYVYAAATSSQDAQADFNIIFSKGSTSVTAEFIARTNSTTSAYYPIFAVVYQNGVDPIPTTFSSYPDIGENMNQLINLLGNY